MGETPLSPWLAGRVLVAMPGMEDPRFHRAVIFVCAHDANGAMGLVLNRVLPGLDLGSLLNQLHIGDAAAPPPSVQTVLGGGPVEEARGFILHSQDYSQKDTVRVGRDFGVTGTVDALRAIAEGRGPKDMLFILGYAGWTAGQLEQELQENAWLVADADPGLIFYTDPDHKWEAAIRRLGVDPAMLSGAAGRA